MTRKILKWIGNLITVLLIILVALSFYSAIQAGRNPGQVASIMGYKPMPVLSGSMSPAIKTGDMVVAKNINPINIEVGDVITYRISQDTLVTHRVIAILPEAGKLMFKTKGDANNTDDQILTAPEDIVGTLAFRIPYGGYIANFIRTPVGFVLFVLLPIAFLIGGEIKNIIKELKKDEKVLKNS